MAKWTAVLIFLINMALVTISGWCDWERVDMGQSDTQLSTIAIGNGRNDGSIRIYAGGLKLYEYSYTDGQWNHALIEDRNVQSSDIKIGDGRNDGVMRVYSAVYFSGINETLKEYSFIDNKWTQDVVGNSATMYSTTHFCIGNGQNDGVMRIYSGKGVEWTYTGGNWNESAIDLWLNTKMIMGTGRNDSAVRIYLAGSGKHHELSFSGSGWDVSEIDHPFDPINNGGVDIAIGKLRNDNVTRLYTVNNSKKIYELSYENDSWITETIGETNEDTKLVIGPGRNDNLNRIYCGSRRGVHEFSFENNKWVKAEVFSVDADASNVKSIASGMGRNDGIVRIYTGNDDGHVYELTWVEPTPTPTASPTSTPDPDDKTNPANIKGQIISSDFVYAAPNPIRGSLAKIHVYCKQPADVTIKLFTMLNREIMSINKRYPAGDNVETIDMSNLANGTYVVFVKARNDQGLVEKVTSKIVLIK